MFFKAYKSILQAKWKHCDVSSSSATVFAGTGDNGYFVDTAGRKHGFKRGRVERSVRLAALKACRHYVDSRSAAAKEARELYTLNC